uniref:Uncharacterized protein n=1 Tax=Piliocolobus tephrosceles TaxID=591936 RepID=A0A8C9LM82_9PRIM
MKTLLHKKATTKLLTREATCHHTGTTNMRKKKTSPKKPRGRPSSQSCRHMINEPIAQWKGTVLDQVPIYPFLYLLLDDYKAGDFRIMPESSVSHPVKREPEGFIDSLIDKCVDYTKEDGFKRTSKVIHQVKAKPMYFIKFDDDFHIDVYDLVKKSC